MNEQEQAFYQLMRLTFRAGYNAGRDGVDESTLDAVMTDYVWLASNEPGVR